MVYRHPHRVERSVEFRPHQDQRPQSRTRHYQTGQLQRGGRKKKAADRHEGGSHRHSSKGDNPHAVVAPKRGNARCGERQQQGGNADGSFEEEVIERTDRRIGVEAEEDSKPSAVHADAEEHDGNSGNLLQNRAPSLDEAPLLRNGRNHTVPSLERFYLNNHGFISGLGI